MDYAARHPIFSPYNGMEERCCQKRRRLRTLPIVVELPPGLAYHFRPLLPVPLHGERSPVVG